MPEKYSYRNFGLRLHSPFPLPELTPDDGDQCAGGTVTISIAPIAASGSAPPGAVLVRPHPEGGIYLEQNNVARFWVSGGREIVIDPAPNVSERDLRLYLLGTVLGTLLLQRGWMLLHANAVVLSGRAIAFAGPSGIGKSTLANYFARAGYDVLCDDVCAVAFDDAARPMAWPGLRRIKLWRDALKAFGQAPDDLEPVLDGVEKYCLPLANANVASPKPLAQLYVLARGEPGSECMIEELRGEAALRAVTAQLYRSEMLSVLQSATQAFSYALSIVHNVRVYRVTRRWGFDAYEAEAEKIAQHMHMALEAGR